MRRRNFVKGAVATFALGAFAETAAASGGSMQFTSLGVNKFDADGDNDISVYFRPATGQVGGRGGVRHFTSEGEPEGDYLTSVQPIPSTPLSAFTSSNPTTLEYDYYDTEANEAATPDEVWVQVRDDGENRAFYRSSNDNDEDGAVGEWLTREIHNEILGKPQYNAGYNWFEVGADDNASGTSLVDIVGEDAELTRVGIGGSNFGGSVVTDFYVDNLRLDGRPVGHFPAEGRGKRSKNRK